MQKGDEKKEDSEKPEPPAAAHPARAEAPAAPGISAAGVLWTFGRCLSALLPVYLAGYYRLSTGLLAVGLVLYSGWRHTRDAKEARLRSAERLQSDAASGGTLRGRRDLPAWVSFPDVEKVEWLNKVLHQAWPFIGQYLKKLLMETIAPTIRSSSTHLQTLNFTKIDFGEKPMKVVGVKAHTENDRGQVLLDVYISYVGDVEIDVEVTRYFCKAGVKGIQLHGMMRVILEPLIEDVPIVGAVTMFFIRRPKLDINWTGLTNLLDIPGLNVMSDTMIMDIIASFLVLPNRLTVPLVPNLPVAQLRSPLPRGVVRIHLLEADRLAAKDNYVKGVMAGLSDPYAVVRVGPQSFTSRHQDDTLNPKWGEVYEVIVHEVPGQELEVEVYDKDPDQDDFLGRTKLDLGIVKKSLIVDEWIPLKDTETGRVRLKLEWLSLLSNTDKLDQVVQRNTTVASKTSDPASSAILAVYLDRAEAIPMKKGKEPSPMVQLSVQDITKESKTCWNTVTPQWEDAFTFFIQNPCKQDLDIQVKDHDHVLNLGSLSIPLVRLLSRPELTLDQWFQLEDSGSASRIYIKAVLRVLWIDEDVVPIPLSPSEFTESAKRPKHTTPDPSFATEGVLRIHLVGGQNLVPKDNLMGGIVKGKSDPYVKISVGGKTFKSHTIKENLNPVWNELYEMVLTQVPGQDVNLEVFDKDMDKDDFMGRVKISLSDLISAQHTDQWFPLSDVKSGRVHLILEWLPTLSEPGRLEQVLRYNTRLSFLNKAVPSSALMFVYVERAHDLPFKKSGKEPKAGAELVLGAASHKTKVCERSSSPQWDESFYFLIPDPREEMLIVKSIVWDSPLGSLVLPIKEVLAEPELVLDQWVSLDGAPASQILLRAELKFKCVLEQCVSVCMSRSGDPSAAPVPSPPSVSMPEKSAAPPAKAVSKGDRVVTAAPELRPQQTTPDPSFATEGVLRIHILAAQNLIAKDNLMGGMVKGKSDPYVKVHIGDKTLKTHVIKENLNPVWNEMYELVLPQSWLILNEVKNGRLHVILEWLSKVSEPEKLNKALQLQSLQSYQNKAVPAAALLFVLLERAHSLPVSHFNPFVIDYSCDFDLIFLLKVCDRSTSPQWNEVFYFLLHDPKEDMLIIKLSSAWEQPLGNLVLPVRELLSKPKLVLDQWLNLDGASAESQILLRAELKVSCEHTHTLNKVLILCFLNGHLPQKCLMQRFQGVLRIHILGAQNLVAMDNLMGGMVKGKSDPYVKVHVGDKTFKSHVIKENLNPIWNEMYELVLNANPDLEVKFELFDKDLDSDDFLGRCLILSDIVNSQYSDKWYTLNDVKSGQVHLILEWLPTVSNPNKLDQVLQLQSLQSYQNKAVPSAALLFVLLERAHSLPLKKSGKEPKAAAELVLRETSHKTKVCDRGCSPRWDEHFYFLVHDPKQDMLILKLSSAWDQPLGNLVLPVKDLLSKPKMVLDQWLHLDGTSFKSQILLRAELKKALLSAAPSGQAGKHGQINLTISYATIEKKLNVTVHSCRGLVTSSKDGLDTYVSLILLPDKSKATKKKTGVKKKDLNPEYNERFEIDLSLDEVQRRSLSVCVKNNSASFMSRDVVGQVSLSLQLCSSVIAWFDLREE
uniref:Extended synaptotagmin-like protein 1b n=1 Tax=Denticeps clupeoides TaxID=299321 RepID=A0AAY4ERV1_9TELE